METTAAPRVLFWNVRMSTLILTVYWWKPSLRNVCDNQKIHERPGSCTSWFHALQYEVPRPNLSFLTRELDMPGKNPRSFKQRL